MTPHNPTWAVVATVDDHPAVTQTFVAWYLSLGAAEIFLYLDRPDDPAADLFAGMPQVHVFRCSPDYWDRLCGRRPVRHQIRQVTNAQDAFVRTAADWLLHVDADEYLWPDGPVADSLGRIEEGAEGALIPVAERRYLPDDPRTHVYSGLFRRPDRFGVPSPPFTWRGVTGHAIGKSFVRVGSDVNVSIHRPRRAGEPLKVPTLPGVELLHFDGMTGLQWVLKLLRKSDAFTNHNGTTPTPHRQMQIDGVEGDPAAALALYDSLKVLSRQEVAALKSKGQLLQAAFDPTEALKSVFGVDHLLACDNYDAWLIAEKSDALPMLKAAVA